MSKEIPVAAPYIRDFEQKGFGLFMHYGLYSLLEKGEWTRNHHKIPKDEYSKLTDRFTASDFKPREIAQLALDSGIRYLCLTTRHHDGFSLYDARGLNDFDAPHSAAKRDLIEEYAEACHDVGISMFFYHTTLDWYVPSFDEDWEAYLDYLNQSIEILCTQYGKVGGFWFDGNWARRDRNWKEDALYGIIRKHQPEAIIVNNSSHFSRGAVGHPEVDIVTFEQGLPARTKREGAPKYLACEMCETINSHWGAAQYDYSHKSPSDLIETLVACRGHGANLLLNIGPEPSGAIPAYDQAVIQMIGRWIHSSAGNLYTSTPTELTCKGKDCLLRDGNIFYYYVHELPITGNMHLSGPDHGGGLKSVHGLLPKVKSITWADSGEDLEFSQSEDQSILTFNATYNPYGHQFVVRVAKIETES